MVGLKEQYEADGVVVLKCPQNEIRPTRAEFLRAAWADVLQAMKDHSLRREGRFLYGRLPSMLEDLLPRSPALVNCALQILGTDIALYMNRLLLKDASSPDGVQPHQDYPYFHGGLPKLCVFVPLLPVKASEGGLIFLKGSHKLGVMPRGDIDRGLYMDFEDLAPDLEPGDIVLMNILTWHYSVKGNGEPRPILQIGYQPSTDGSYGGRILGVTEPTLISGEWKTTEFSEFKG